MTLSTEHILAILGYLIGFSGGIKYIVEIIRGRVKPNRVSWFFWALAPLVSTYIAIFAGSDIWATFRVFMSGFLPLLVFIFSFVNKNSYWRITMFDIFCGVFSLIAIAVWWFYHSSDISILLAIVADIFAGIPTLYKAWKYPESEIVAPYVASLVSVILIIPSIKEWSILNSGFQIYLLIMDSLLVLVISRKRIIKYVMAKR